MKKFDKTGEYDEISGQIKLFFILAGQMDIIARQINIELLKEVVNDLGKDYIFQIKCLAYYGSSFYDKKSKYEQAKGLLKFIELLSYTNDKIKK